MPEETGSRYLPDWQTVGRVVECFDANAHTALLILRRSRRCAFRRMASDTEPRALLACHQRTPAWNSHRTSSGGARSVASSVFSPNPPVTHALGRMPVSSGARM